MMLNAIVHDGLTQHRDQMGLRASGFKFVNDMKVAHKSSERCVVEYFRISRAGELPQARRIRNNSNGDLQK